MGTNKTYVEVEFVDGITWHQEVTGIVEADYHNLTPRIRIQSQVIPENWDPDDPQKTADWMNSLPLVRGNILKLCDRDTSWRNNIRI